MKGERFRPELSKELWTKRLVNAMTDQRLRLDGMCSPYSPIQVRNIPIADTLYLGREEFEDFIQLFGEPKVPLLGTDVRVVLVNLPSHFHLSVKF